MGVILVDEARTGEPTNRWREGMQHEGVSYLPSGGRLGSWNELLSPPNDPTPCQKGWVGHVNRWRGL